MKTKLLTIASLLLTSPALYPGETGKAPIDTPAAFARLKSLAGDWEASGGGGKVRLSYRVIAGGTAVVEREQGEHMPEMLTVYYMDGNRLLLTHFCMAGNQPRMEAASYDPATGDLQFRFLDVTNLTTPGAGHMHNGAFRFVDENHLNSDWQFYENGQLKKTESARFTRVR
jgi:hypothetical protein